MSISEAFAFYEAHHAPMNLSTQKNYRWAMCSLTKVVQDIDVSILGLDHIMLWRTSMCQEGIASTSINTQLSKVRSVLRFLAENEMRVLDYHRLTRVKEAYKPKTWLLPDEICLLVKAATTPRNKALIKAYFATGCRLSELLGLDRADFENAESFIHEEQTIYKIWVCGKGDKYRPVYYDVATKQLIENYLATRNDRFKPLFMSEQNNRLGPSMVEKMLHKTAREAGLEKRVTPHVLRHSFTSDLAMNNAPIPAISKLLGHARMSTTLNIYTHITDKQTEMAYATSRNPMEVA